MDLSNISFTIKKGDFVVDVDRGYIGYGRVGAETVERLSHFFAWEDMPSVAVLRSWCRSFLDSLIAYEATLSCPSTDREIPSHACVVNAGGYCSACGAGRDHS